MADGIDNVMHEADSATKFLGEIRNYQVHELEGTTRETGGYIDTWTF